MRKLPFQNISEKEKKNFGNTMSMYVGFRKDVYTVKEAADPHPLSDPQIQVIDRLMKINRELSNRGLSQLHSTKTTNTHE